MTHPWRGLGRLPRSVWILSSVTLINRLGTMALPFLVLYLTRSRGFSAGRAGFVLTIYGLTALAAGPVGGRLADRIGAVRVLQGSLFLSGLVLLIYPLASSPAVILGLTMAWAFTNEAFRPANLAMFSELVRPEQRRTAFALARLAVNLGMSVGPAAGGFLAMVSFPAIFVADGATSILAGIVLTLSAGRLRSVEAAPHATATGRAHADRRLLYFLAALLPILLVFFQHEAAMAVFVVRDLGLAEASFGVLFTINTLLNIFLEVPLNLRTAAWPYRRTLALGAFLMGAGFGGMALATGFRSVALTVVLWTFGEMVLLPASSGYVADIAPARSRGAYMGLYTMSFSAAFALGPWIGTTMLDRNGPTVVWEASFLLGCLSTAMMTRVAPPPVHARDEPPPLVVPSGEAV